MQGVGPISNLQLSTLLNPCPKPLSVATMTHRIAFGPCTLQVIHSGSHKFAPIAQQLQKVILANTPFHSL